MSPVSDYLFQPVVWIQTNELFKNVSLLFVRRTMFMPAKDTGIDSRLNSCVMKDHT